MKFYLAASYSRGVEMQEYAKQLEALGHIVTSRWINGNHEVGDHATSSVANAVRHRFATEDIQDLEAADVVINFTGGDGRKRGGRHVELGYALAKQKECVLIGERENVFHYLPMPQYDDWAHFYEDVSHYSEDWTWQD